MLVEFSRSICNYYALWCDMGLIDIGECEALRRDIPLLWTNVALMRVGMSMGDPAVKSVIDELMNYDFSDWGSHLLLWQWTMKQLSTVGNAKFAEYIPRSLIGSFGKDDFRRYVSTPGNEVPDAISSAFDESLDIPHEQREKQFELSFMLFSIGRTTLDPAYQTYDNWMSQMQHFFDQQGLGSTSRRGTCATTGFRAASPSPPPRAGSRTPSAAVRPPSGPSRNRPSARARPRRCCRRPC